MGIRQVIVLAAAWFAATTALAGEVRVVEPDDPVADGVSYADLLRQVVPDLDAGSGAGSRVVSTRRLDGYAAENVPLAPFKVSAVPVIAFEDGNAPRILLLLDLGGHADSAEGLAIAALFDGKAPYRLVDAADVALDRSTGFADPAHLVSASGEDVFVIYSEHFNSNQTYGFYTLITTERGRLVAIDTISTLSDRSCAGETTQTASFAFGEGPARAEPILANVAIENIPGKADCGDTPVLAPSKKQVSVMYRRDASSGGYVADSDSFEQLARENEQRY